MDKPTIYKELRYGLPVFKKEYRINPYEDDASKEALRDKRTHILATCMAAYPFTPTNRLAEEFGINPKTIKALAMMYGIRKEKNVVSVINRKNGLKADRSCCSKVVEKVARNGRVIAVFESASKAADDAGVDGHLITTRCRGVIKSPLNGYRYRYKK